MLSGSGRTLQNLLEHMDRGGLRARVALVIASRECEGAARARARVPEVLVIPGEIAPNVLECELRGRGIGWVALAGYLRKMHVPDGFKGKIVNIHPALLPRHGGPGMFGTRVHASVLSSGDVESGCTVHLVDDEYDRGTILLQRRCPVMPGDTPETLAARVFIEECIAYPQALSMLLEQESP